jgi:hypothetical protein
MAIKSKAARRGSGTKAGGRSETKSAKSAGAANKGRTAKSRTTTKAMNSKATTAKGRGASTARSSKKSQTRGSGRPGAKSSSTGSTKSRGAGSPRPKSNASRAGTAQAKRRTAGSAAHGRGVARDKVGSSVKAADAVGGALDFGVPADRARGPVMPGGYGKGPDPGTGPMREEGEGVRTSGVGAPPGPPGAGSGGDLDADFIGFDGRGGVAKDPGERRTKGPDITEGGSAPFASGPPARGENERRPGGVGGPRPVLDTVDHSGGDVTTSGAESDESAEPQSEDY